MRIATLWWRVLSFNWLLGFSELITPEAVYGTPKMSVIPTVGGKYSVETLPRYCENSSFKLVGPCYLNVGIKGKTILLSPCSIHFFYFYSKFDPFMNLWIITKQLHWIKWYSLRAYEQELTAYTGDDPLNVRYEFITWLDGNYGKENVMDIFFPTLEDTLKCFWNVVQYQQDSRFIQLLVTYVSSLFIWFFPNPIVRFSEQIKN